MKKIIFLLILITINLFVFSQEEEKNDFGNIPDIDNNNYIDTLDINEYLKTSELFYQNKIIQITKTTMHKNGVVCVSELTDGWIAYSNESGKIEWYIKKTGEVKSFNYIYNIKSGIEDFKKINNENDFLIYTNQGTRILFFDGSYGNIEYISPIFEHKINFINFKQHYAILDNNYFVLLSNRGNEIDTTQISRKWYVSGNKRWLQPPFFESKILWQTANVLPEMTSDNTEFNSDFNILKVLPNYLIKLNNGLIVSQNKYDNIPFDLSDIEPDGFVKHRNQISKLDLETGKILWTSDTLSFSLNSYEKAGWYTSLNTVIGIIHQTHNNNSWLTNDILIGYNAIAKIDTLTGKIIYENVFDLGRIIYYTNENPKTFFCYNGIVQIDIQTGQIIWKKQIELDYKKSISNSDFTKNGMYINTNQITKINLTSGEFQWRTENLLDSIDNCCDNFFIYNDGLIVTKNEFIMLDTLTGKIKWRNKRIYNDKFIRRCGNIFMVGGEFLAPDFIKNIFKLNLENGEILWKKNISKNPIWFLFIKIRKWKGYKFCCCKNDNLFIHSYDKSKHYQITENGKMKSIK